MKYPKFLEKKDTIGVPAPSAGVIDEAGKNRVLNAIDAFEEMDYNLVLSDNLYFDQRGRSADAKTRAEEFNDMIKNEDIDFILCLAGGEFLIEMLPYVDFKLLKIYPKFVAGFSDPTGLLYPITTKYDIATIYGQNFKSFGIEKFHDCQNDFLDIVEGKILEEHSYDLYEDTPLERETGLEQYNLTEEVYWNTLSGKNIKTKGRIIGGCFDIIAELSGTKYDGINEFNEKYKDDGIIWYFDNCEESMEETIRILWKLNELNYFKYTKCVIFGRFGVNSTYNDYNVKTCLEDSILNELNIPVIYDADISHKSPCLTIINGSVAEVEVCDGEATIKFELK